MFYVRLANHVSEISMRDTVDSWQYALLANCNRLLLTDRYDYELETHFRCVCRRPNFPRGVNGVGQTLSCELPQSAWLDESSSGSG